MPKGFTSQGGGLLVENANWPMNHGQGVKRLYEGVPHGIKRFQASLRRVFQAILGNAGVSPEGVSETGRANERQAALTRRKSMNSPFRDRAVEIKDKYFSLRVHSSPKTGTGGFLLTVLGRGEVLGPRPATSLRPKPPRGRCTSFADGSAPISTSSANFPWRY